MKEKEYTEKRNLTASKEPKSGSRFKKKSDQPIFVIQKHDASQLHYDFRLEIDGTLKSWSVPKGPSTDPSEKRMAIPTEDHPIDYAFFEGTIPEEEYGGGTVMIWDRGDMENLKTDDGGQEISLEDSYEMGTVEVKLHGKKLQGGYALIKMKGGKMEGNWLLTKMKDEAADARRNPVNTETKSVVSGRSLKEIAEDNPS
jgi:DNA ligase D-like protein (predicted 3'-phosphoesterase)